MPTEPMSRVEALAVVEKIRELHARKVRIVDIKKRTGWSWCRIWHVINGRTYKTEPITINALRLIPSDKLCRRCGEPALFVSTAYQLVCVKCAVAELARKGLVTVEDHK